MGCPVCGGSVLPPSTFGGKPARTRTYCSRRCANIASCRARAQREREARARGEPGRKAYRPAALAIVCNEPDCTATTYEEKPFCPDHIDRLPYVAALLARWDALGRQDTEDDGFEAMAVVA